MNWKTIDLEIDKICGEEGFFQDLQGAPKPCPRESTGLFLVDHILGGGMPRGRIIELMGPESSGKTTFVNTLIAHLQQTQGARAVYFDYEHTWSPEYAAHMGVNLAKPYFYFSQPTTMEQGFAAMESLIQNDLCDIAVWDTVAAAMPMKLLARASDEPVVPGIHALAFTYGLGRLASPVRKSKVIALFVNQLRSVIGGYGPSETTPGGRALKFYASVRMDIRKVGSLDKKKVHDEVMGTNQQEPYRQTVRFYTYKNKTHAPFKKCEVPLVFGEGYDDVGSVLDLAVSRKIIKKFGGGNYELPTGKSLRGYENMVELFSKNPGALDAIKMLLRKVDIPVEPEEIVELEGSDATEFNTEEAAGVSSSDEGNSKDSESESTGDGVSESGGSAVDSEDLGDNADGEATASAGSAVSLAL